MLRQLDPVDVRPWLGKAFYQQNNRFLLSDKKRADFLNQLKVNIPELSKREKECLLLYLQGETAKGIAQVLQLSHRTIESYLHNLKCKLNCFYKTDLIKKAQELHDFGLLA